jgi:hypothetical protein
MSKNRRGENWIYMLSCILRSFFHYFENVDEEIISQIKLLIHRVMGNRVYVQQINSIIKINALKVIES